MTNIINRNQVALTLNYFASVIEYENGTFEVAVFDNNYEPDTRVVEDVVNFSSQDEVNEFIEKTLNPAYTGFVQSTYQGVDLEWMQADVAKAAKYYIKCGDSVDDAVRKAKSFVEYYGHTYRIYA